MENRIYFDTNLFVDLFDLTRPNAKASLQFFRNAVTRGHKLFLNSDTVTTGFYILSKTKHFEHQQMLTTMQKSVRIFEVVEVGNQEIETAFSLCRDPSTPFHDYEDTVQFVCARKIGADLIVTQDRDFVSDGIEVLVPTL